MDKIEINPMEWVPMFNDTIIYPFMLRARLGHSTYAAPMRDRSIKTIENTLKDLNFRLKGVNTT